MLALLAALALATPLVRVEPRAERTLFDEVSIVVRGHRLAPMDVLVDGGVVVSIEPGGDPGEPGATGLLVVPGKGLTLLPGFVDVHAHVSASLLLPGNLRMPRPRANEAAYLWAGVTTILDPGLGGDAWRKLREKRWPGPEIVAAGDPFTAVGGHPVSSARSLYPHNLLVRAMADRIAHQVSGPQDVDGILDAEGEVWGTKVMLDRIPADAPTLDDATLSAIRVGATGRGRRLVAHVGSPEDVDRALAVGVDRLAHLPSRGALGPERVAALAAAGTPTAPTIAVWDACGDVARGLSPVGPLSHALATPADDDAFAGLGPDTVPAGFAAWGLELALAWGDRRANAREVWAAGVPIAVGSDSPNVGTLPGDGYHRELDALASAGIPAAAIVDAAGRGGAAYLGRDDIGRLAEGAQADLVLVDGDPTFDVAALHRVVGVWVDGRRVWRRADRGALADVEARER